MLKKVLNREDFIHKIKLKYSKDFEEKKINDFINQVNNLPTLGSSFTQVGILTFNLDYKVNDSTKLHMFTVQKIFNENNKAIFYKISLNKISNNNYNIVEEWYVE